MHFLDEKLRKIWLHESSIQKINCEQDNIILEFKNGFWDFDHIQKNNCKITITIKNLNEKNVNGFVNITELGIFRRKQIDLTAFNKKMGKSEFTIEVDYYSEFEKSLLLIGRTKKTEIFLKITDIDQLSYQYE